MARAAFNPDNRRTVLRWHQQIHRDDTTKHEKADSELDRLEMTTLGLHNQSQLTQLIFEAPVLADVKLLASNGYGFLAGLLHEGLW